jgi:hypothetical protein
VSDVAAPTMEKIEECIEVDPSTEGTLHQLALGDQAKRKHFFSPLDPVYAEAVHKDAETVVYTPEEEVCDHGSANLRPLIECSQKKVRRKIDNIVLPLVICR